jgi:hypothetical protein
MRCPSCNKFVSYDTDVEPEENNQEIDGTTFNASYRRVLTCGDCGEELKEAEIEVSYDFSGDIEEVEKSEKTETKEEHEHSFEIESCDVEATTGAVTKDRHGRPIRNSRYMATLYGVECQVEVKCECGATASFTTEESERASSFDELV